MHFFVGKKLSQYFRILAFFNLALVYCIVSAVGSNTNFID